MEKAWRLTIVVMVIVTIIATLALFKAYSCPDSTPGSFFWYVIPLACDIHTDTPMIADPPKEDVVTIIPENIDINSSSLGDIMVEFYNLDNTEYWVMEVYDNQGECNGMTCSDGARPLYDDSMIVLANNETTYIAITISPGEEQESTFTVKFCGKSDGTEITDCDEADIIHQKEFLMTVRR